MFDTHSHTVNSLDGKQTADELCEAAIRAGLEGVTFTDHADIWFYESTKTLDRITNSVKDAENAAKKYAGKLKVFKGVEMAEYYFHPTDAEKIMKITDFDVVLGSCHSVEYRDWLDSYSRLDFSEENAPLEKIYAFLDLYFHRVLDIARYTDIDILCHVDCPLRYINGKFGRGVTTDRFDRVITEIFAEVIRRGISLEINTSGLNSAQNSLMPSIPLIKKYYDMGGRMITIGSDSHTVERTANGFDEAVKILKDIGFTHYNHYEKRKPISHEM